MTKIEQLYQVLHDHGKDAFFEELREAFKDSGVADYANIDRDIAQLRDEFNAGFESAEIAIATDFEQAYFETGLEGTIKKTVELINSLYEDAHHPYEYAEPLNIISKR